MKFSLVNARSDQAPSATRTDDLPPIGFAEAARGLDLPSVGIDTLTMVSPSVGIEWAASEPAPDGGK